MARAPCDSRHRPNRAHDAVIGLTGFLWDRGVALMGVGFDWLLVAGGVVLVLATYGMALASPWLAAVMRFLGPTARLAGFGMILVGSLRLYAAFEVDRALASYQERERAAVEAVRADERRKADDALAQAVAAAEDRARASQPIRERVIREAVPSSCPVPANLLAAGAELLRRHPANGGSAGGASRGADRPMPAAGAIPGPRQP